MFSLIASFLLAAYALIVLKSGFASKLYAKGCRVFYACPLILLINLENTQLIAGFYLLKAMIASVFDSARVLHSFSNHFIIDLDIAFLFSSMILIFFHGLKLP